MQERYEPTIIDYLLLGLIVFMAFVGLFLIVSHPNPPPEPCSVEQLAEVLEIADHPYVEATVIKALEDNMINVDEYSMIKFLYAVQMDGAEKGDITKQIAQKVVE